MTREPLLQEQGPGGGNLQVSAASAKHPLFHKSGEKRPLSWPPSPFLSRRQCCSLAWRRPGPRSPHSHTGKALQVTGSANMPSELLAACRKAGQSPSSGSVGDLGLQGTSHGVLGPLHEGAECCLQGRRRDCREGTQTRRTEGRRVLTSPASLIFIKNCSS